MTVWGKPIEVNGKTPAEWAIERAGKLFDEGYDEHLTSTQSFARYIEQHEEAPVDPDLEIAREAAANSREAAGAFSDYVEYMRLGHYDTDSEVQSALAAIKLARKRGKL